MAVVEGRKAPAFTLKNLQGLSVSNKDYEGKDLILYFYPRDDTPGCTKEACGFRDLWKKIQKRGAVVVGVSPDSPEAHQKFVAKYKLPFDLLCDPEHKVMEKFGAYGEKVLYGKKTQGVIRSTVWIGPDGKVRKHWKRVAKAEDHPSHVLAVLETAVFALMALLIGGTAQAHTLDASLSSFVGCFDHPLAGWDHLLATLFGGLVAFALGRVLQRAHFPIAGWHIAGAALAAAVLALRFSF